jgi:hypothetical protein
MAEMDDADLRASASREIAACLLSQRNSVAGALYRVIPSCKELKVHDDAFLAFSLSRQCIALLRNDRSPCSCPNATRGTDQIAVTCDPQHATSCPLGDGFTQRHDAGCQVIHEILRHLPLAHAVAQYHNRDHTRRGDQTPDFDITNFPKSGDLAYVEYSVVDPLQGSLISASSQTEGSAAAKRDRDKTTKYQNLALQTNHVLYTASQETTGRISMGFRKFIELCDKAREPSMFENTYGPHLTWACTSFVQFCTQRIAIGFWSGSRKMETTRQRLNAFTMNGRFPAPSHSGHSDRGRGWASRSRA